MGRSVRMPFQGSQQLDDLQLVQSVLSGFEPDVSVEGPNRIRLKVCSTHFGRTVQAKNIFGFPELHVVSWSVDGILGVFCEVHHLFLRSGSCGDFYSLRKRTSQGCWYADISNLYGLCPNKLYSPLHDLCMFSLSGLSITGQFLSAFSSRCSVTGASCVFHRVCSQPSFWSFRPTQTSWCGKYDSCTHFSVLIFSIVQTRSNFPDCKLSGTVHDVQIHVAMQILV